MKRPFWEALSLLKKRGGKGKMQKKGYLLLFSLPILLFGMCGIFNLAATQAGGPIDNSNLLILDEYFGAILSPFFTYFLLSILGLTFVGTDSKNLQTIGKAFYGVGMISGFFLYRKAGLAFKFIADSAAAPVNEMTFGGIILLISVISGLLFAAYFIIEPLMEGIYRRTYGNSDLMGSTVKEEDPFAKLRNWNALLKDTVISENEYNRIKLQVLDSIRIKKASAFEFVSHLKELEKEGIITIEDFESKKNEILR